MSGIPSWARVGAKIVYVGGSRRGRSWRELGFKLDSFPQKNVIYTIREVKSDGFLRLAEFKISGLWPDGRRFTDGWYDAESFRPLITQADDISTHFEALLHVRNPQLEAAE